VKRVLPDGKELLPPAIAGLFTMTHGRRNFNVAWTGKDGKPASLSVVAEYTLTGGKYCQKVKFWRRTTPTSQVSAMKCRRRRMSAAQ